MLALLLLGTAGCASRSSVNPRPSVVTTGAWRMPPWQDFVDQIPPPPAPGSAAQRRDIERVLAVQARATPEEIARAQKTLHLSVFTFARAVQADFTPERYPLTSIFFLRLNDIVREINDGLKNHFRRPHPFEADPRIRRFVVAPAAYSYPSYHSARCVVFWHTLARLDRQAAGRLKAIAEAVEQERVLAGEHFPTDITAGRLEGHLILAALERDAGFLADLERLKKLEWEPRR